MTDSQGGQGQDQARGGALARARDRVLGTHAGWLGLELIGVTLVAILAGMVGSAVPVGRDSPGHALAALVVAAVVIAAYSLCRRKLEGHVGEGEFAPRGAPLELAGGLLLGFAVFSAIVGVVALLGGFEITDRRFPGHLWSILAMAITSGVIEETLFRGIAFRHLEAMFGSAAALVATSAFFGLAHITNPNATWFAAFAIALEAGVLLGAAFMLTRRLWLAVGLHAGWNFTQGWVYSIPVSGGEAPLGLFASRRIGPDWLTGGDFGLEASVVALIIAALAGFALLALAIRRGRMVAPRRNWPGRGDQTKL